MVLESDGSGILYFYKNYERLLPNVKVLGAIGLKQNQKKQTNE